MKDRPAVLVTDGQERSALAVVRSLGAAGCRVEVAAVEPRSLAGGSRFATAEHLVPDPARSPAVCLEAVAALREARNLDLVLPVTDASMMVLLATGPGEGLLPTPFPSRDRFEALSDKWAVRERAAELGIAVPGQTVMWSPAEQIDGRCSFPVVVKPTRSVTLGPEGLERHRVRIARTPDQLTDILRVYPASAYPLLLQQYVEGDGAGLFLLRWEGTTRAVFAHRRLREKPPDGGVSVYRESVRADPGLVAKAERLLDVLGWSGVAMVEFRRDREGVSYLMEVNARFWGSLQLAIESGVDFPRLLVEAWSGRPPERPPAYREGIRSRWWWGDVDHLIARLRSPSETTAGRVRALAAFLRLWRPGDRSEVLRLGDPVPFLRETGHWLASALQSSGTASRGSERGSRIAARRAG